MRREVRGATHEGDPMNALVSAIHAAAIAQGVDPVRASELANNAAAAAQGAIAAAVEHRVELFGLHADPDAIAEDAVARLDATRRVGDGLAHENSRNCDRIFALETALRRAWASRRRLRRERDMARRQLAAVQSGAQRLARAGRSDVLAAEVPESWWSA